MASQHTHRAIALREGAYTVVANGMDEDEAKHPDFVELIIPLKYVLVGNPFDHFFLWLFCNRRTINKKAVFLGLELAIAKYLEGWERYGDTGFIARLQDGTPVGSVAARLSSAGNRGFGFVADRTPEIGIAVLPEYRGNGIGRQLLLKLLDDLKKRGFTAVSLSVDADNPAKRLYHGFGFIEIGTTGTSRTMVLYFD